MKFTLTAILFLPLLCFGAGMKISDYPTTNFLGPNQRFIVTAGSTNMGVNASDMADALSVAKTNQPKLWMASLTIPTLRYDDDPDIPALQISAAAAVWYDFAGNPLMRFIGASGAVQLSGSSNSITTPTGFDLPVTLLSEGTETNHAVTKGYVDGLSSLSVQYYFHGQTNSALTNLAQYKEMWKSDVQRAAIFTNTFTALNAASNGQYIVSFLSGAPPGIKIFREGAYIVNFNAYTEGAGVTSMALTPEIYIRRTTGEEIEIGTGAPHVIGESDFNHVVQVTVTTNVTIGVTDGVLVKFKASAITATPTLTLRFVTQGNTSAGINVPAESANFVLKTGDTMTGTLNAPVVTASSNVLYVLSTNAAIAAVTNFAVDMLLSRSVIFAAADLNFAHATNLYAGRWQTAVVKIYTGATNRQVWLPSTWSAIGSSTNYSVLASNKVAILSVASDGNQQTNASFVLVSQP